ncbi:uncharacterized protein A1O9_13121 [Exophiala aquamarina CBS 119918]|uniref:Uncharacterized protein n=1 Tax=Exophiala aquamarina CBS 119918 TaxID=1182545 RepID=A0A072NUY0_9EURO|nr:uncharacterized protein A1O9_13121 [Exophiala aquamarina CBS 119918]KEF50828.1 hypothetical protein A1O9_13121 [Exophiala aquamarina CBS 119918]
MAQNEMLGSAYCDACHRRFAGLSSLQQHLTQSSAHHATAKDRITIQALYTGLEQLTPDMRMGASGAIQHPDAVGGGGTLEPIFPPVPSHGRGVPKALVSPVFAFLCRRSANMPELSEVIRRTKSTLDPMIILSLMEAARRLNPPDSGPEGTELRRVQQQQRAARAQLSEDSFVERFRHMGYHFLREVEQREQAEARGWVPRATPDIFFASPVFLCGQLCHWVEYKHYFGFPKNPFVAGKEKQQVQKYLTQLGPGVIVFELGFQSGHLKRDGLGVFRAEEVLDNLSLQGIDPARRG